MGSGDGEYEDLQSSSIYPCYKNKAKHQKREAEDLEIESFVFRPDSTLNNPSPPPLKILFHPHTTPAL